MYFVSTSGLRRCESKKSNELSNSVIILEPFTTNYYVWTDAVCVSNRFCLMAVSLHTRRSVEKISPSVPPPPPRPAAGWTCSHPGDPPVPSASQEAFIDTHMTLCTWIHSPGGGAASAPMTPKIRVEIRSEFVMKTVINSSLQFVYCLPGSLFHSEQSMLLLKLGFMAC